MSTTAAVRAAWAGVLLTVVLLLVAFGAPHWLDWDVAARAPRNASPHEVPPLHGLWRPKLFGPGTFPRSLVAPPAVGGTPPTLADRLPWRRLLLASYAGALAWLLSLALVDGWRGSSRSLGNRTSTCGRPARSTDVRPLLETYVDRIPYAAEDNWPTHVAGHPPGALLFFVGLVRVGLGGDLAAGVVVTVLAASTAVAVLVTLRALDAEEVARRAAPFLVLTPAAVFMAVSADALFAAVTAWGLACLALATRRLCVGGARGPAAGYGVLMSYGLPLLGLLALAVLVAARSWRPLPVAAGGGAGGGARVRCGRLRVVGRLPGAARALLRRDRAGPAAVLLVVRRPGLPGRQRRAAAAAGARLRPPCATRAARVPLLLVGAAVVAVAIATCRHEQGRGRADLAAVRAVADRVLRAAARRLAAVGARGPGGRGAGGAAPLLHGVVMHDSSAIAPHELHVVPQTNRVVRPAAARSRTPAAPARGATSAVKPSSVVARAGEATTCRTSPSR